MKKSTIKRRKRIAPAYPEASSAERTSTSPQPGTSASPEPIDVATEIALEGPAAKRQRPPPSIDFTGYDPESSSSIQVGSSAQSDYVETARVASTSFTAVNDATRPTAKNNDNENDGSLELDRRKTERRERLLREAEEMRAALRAKEQEISEL
jgi:hypothetical protein